MSPTNAVHLLAFAAGALAIPNFGGRGAHQHAHSHWGHGHASGSWSGSAAPFPYPSRNATGIWGSTGGTGLPSGAVSTYTYSSDATVTTVLTQTDTWGQGAPSVGSASAASSSPVAVVSAAAASSGASGCTEGDVTVTTTEEVTVYVTAGASSANSYSSTVTIMSTSYIYPGSSSSSSSSASSASSSSSPSSNVVSAASASASASLQGYSAPSSSSPAWSSSSSSSSSSVEVSPVTTSTTSSALTSAPASSSPTLSSYNNKGFSWNWGSESSIVTSSTSSSTYVAPTSSAPATTSSAPASSTTSYASSSAAASSAWPASSSTSSSSSSSSSSGWSGKRGLAYNDASLCDSFIGASDVSWAYNWASSSSGLSSEINYIPLLWGTSSDFTDSWNTNAKSAIAAGAEYIFSFNEPDDSSQANLSPSDAAAAYLQYIEPFAGQAKLCAPSVTNGGGSMGLDWLNAFLTECSTCTIDCINIHWYDTYQNADYFKTQVNNATAIGGGKPVFVSEFGCTDGSDSEISGFLEDVMPWMDANSNVTGYAYFMVSDGLLVSGTAPSSYGETYLSYSA